MQFLFKSIKFLGFFLFSSYFLLDAEAVILFPKKMKANFVQITQRSLQSRLSKKKQDGKKREKRVNGSLSYQAPYRIRLSLEGPSEQLYISDGMKTWFYQGPFVEKAKGEVTIQEGVQGPLIRLFQLLGKEAKSNQELEVRKKKKGVYQLLFRKNLVQELDVKEALLFYESDLEQSRQSIPYPYKMILTRPNKKKVEFQFSDFKTNPKFSKNEFTFDPPPGTIEIR